MNEKSLNPWLSMWIHPKETIQQIISSSESDKWVFLLAMIAGFSQSLDRASMKNLGDTVSVSQIILGSLVAAPFVAWITLYIGGGLIKWTGKWFGGQSSSENIRVALAWSGVPIVWALILWIPEYFLFGKELFTTDTPTIVENAGIFYMFCAVEFVIGCWALIVLLKSLSQVQGFSAWKALGNLLASVSVVILPIILIIVAVALLIK